MLDVDYSVEAMKREIAIREATQNEFKNYEKKLHKDSCRLLMIEMT